MVRRGIANPLFASSILAPASNFNASIDAKVDVNAGMAELVDAGDLKSPGGDTVPVRLRLSVPQIVVQKDLSKPISLNAGRFFYWCITKRQHTCVVRLAHHTHQILPYK